ncbi:DUF2486 family protein [Paraburkholderia antibiotica]|uniref:DUF2486 family protein n=1 Tax=Paraburkholderia antibiotica TaxID=2728839 RepID=A0A7X9X3Q8_9BURK|nr:DUF2486 family protein [Paraburkholderia antibiotica]NML30914.1 DUF2486 family protein [Paraburkholderia antibiotica]
MSDPNDNSIPVLNEVIVPGRASQTRDTSADAGAAVAPAAQSGAEPAAQAVPPSPTPREPTFRTEPAFVPPPAQQAEPVLAPEPVLTPEQMVSPAPVLAPAPLSTAPAVHQDRPPASTEAQAELHQPHVADHTHAKQRQRPHHGVHVRHGHEDVHEDTSVSPGVFDRTEPAIPLEAGATVPPDVGSEAAQDVPRDVPQDAAQAAEPPLDTDAIAERLRGRFASFLTGDGRGIIEARCRDALQQHTNLLVTQITREVAQTLEAEMTGWVREAVEEELARHAGRA